MNREPESIYRSPTSNGDGDIGNIKDRIRYFETGTTPKSNGRVKSVSFKISKNQEYSYTREPESEDNCTNNAVSMSNMDSSGYNAVHRDEDVKVVHNESENIDEILSDIVKSNIRELPINLNPQRPKVSESAISYMPSNLECKLGNNSTNKPIIDSSSGIESKLDAIKQSLLKNEAEQYRDEERLKEIQRICNVRVHKGEDVFDEIISTEVESAVSSFDFSDFNNKLNELSRDAEANDEIEDKFEDLKLLDIDSEEKRRYGKFTESDFITPNETPISYDNDSETDSNSTYAKMVKESIKMISKFKNEAESDVEFKIIKQSEQSEEKTVKLNNNSSTVSDEKFQHKSREIVDDFMNFDERPEFLKCPILRKPQKHIISRNLYAKENIELFSKQHIQQEKIVLRAPGAVMETKPLLRLMSSVVAEESILYYIQVYNGNTYWHLRKRLDGFMLGNTSEAAELALVKISNLPDNEFSKFILSNITERIFRRTSYVFYNQNIVLLKFIGNVLCICNKDRIEKVVNIKNLRSEGDDKFVVDDEVFVCSCKIERDEWYSLIITSL